MRFYFVEYDIKFKKGSHPVDSGRYCIVMRLEKEHGKWLINDNYSRAVKKNDGTIGDNKLIIDVSKRELNFKLSLLIISLLIKKDLNIFYYELKNPISYRV